MANVLSSKLPQSKKDEFVFGDWTIKTIKSHIMNSKCESLEKCKKAENSSEMCYLCYYERELNMPSLPDMVFADNEVTIMHKNGSGIKFATLDALKQVGKTAQHIEVAHAKVWQEARSDCEYATRAVKDYDWTYTTSYAGTLIGSMRVLPTEDRIDLEKLRVQEEIKFYQEIFLYEDELDDNGSTRCTVKVRVMPSGFFAVFRHYLRVDHVMIRVHDTRLYHALGTEGILRESSLRESHMSKIKVEPDVYKNPDHVWQHLPIVKESVEILIPDSAS